MSAELSPEARKLIVRLLVELRRRSDENAACWEAGIAICDGVFNCLPIDLDDYNREIAQDGSQEIFSRQKTTAKRTIRAINPYEQLRKKSFLA